MKIYRLLTLLAAVLITFFFARVFTHEKVGSLEQQSPVAAVDVAGGTLSRGA